MKTNNLEQKHTCSGCGTKLSVEMEPFNHEHGTGHAFKCPNCGYQQGNLPSPVVSAVAIREQEKG